MTTPAAAPAEGAWVAVIIPHYNDVVRLDRCLTALARQDGLARAEVVVVDNASTQSLVAITAAHPHIRIVVEPQKGAAAARNRGVRETTAPYLLFLDADCVPAAGWLVVAEQAAPRADLIGGRVDVFDETPPPRSGAEAFETVFAFDCRSYVERKGFSVTANLLTRREVFTDVGDLIPGLSEDLDWCHRATAKGYGLIYEDALRVSHPTRSDWPALLRKWHRLTQESFALQPQGRGARLRWGLRALAMPFSALAHIPRILFSAKLSGIRERLRAILTLIRLRLLRMTWMLRQTLGSRI